MTNLYAARVFAEHPVGIWPIDEELTFLSLISPGQRDLRLWETNSEVSYHHQGPDLAGSGQAFFVSGPSWDGEFYVHELVSPELFVPFYDLSHDQRTFSVNTYVQHVLPVGKYELGYKVLVDGEYVEFIEEFGPGQTEEWIRLGATFDHDFGLSPVRVFIRVFFHYVSGSDEFETWFYATEPSVGQWAEVHSINSLGVLAEEIDPRSGLQRILGDVYGVELNEYGGRGKPGYALIKNQRLLAVNEGIPLVFGSGSSTTLVHADGYPSVVFPGKGFLHEKGTSNNYTFETWLRLSDVSATGGRIIGPLTSDDGVYVRGNSIALVFGDHVGVHVVDQWGVPMLLHIVWRDRYIELFINGERVISLDVLGWKPVAGRPYDDDWIGFFGLPGMLFEIDTVSIYPFAVPLTVAKRRFVWGQGVESPESMNTAYLGVPHNISFPHANYSRVFTYPDDASWLSGRSENIAFVTGGITPEFPVTPHIVAGAVSEDEILRFSAVRGGLTLGYPGNPPAYIDFGNLFGVASADWGIFADFVGNDDGPLMSFGNKEFEIVLEGLFVRYYFNGEVFEQALVDPNERFLVGLDLAKLPEPVVEFFRGNPKMLVGGNGTETYVGEIGGVYFCAPRDIIETEPSGVAFSVADIDNPTRSVFLDYPFGKPFLQVQSSGIWSASLPLSYLVAGERLGLLQVNHGPDLNVSAQASISDTEFDRDDPTIFSGYFPSGSVISTMGSMDESNKFFNLFFRVTADLSTRYVLKETSILVAPFFEEDFFEMGTLHGHSMYPYSKRGIYYSNEAHPWVTYRNTAPYLYLTDDSGVQPLPGSVRESGIWLPVNEGRLDDFKVSALQVWVNYAESAPEERTELFSVHLGKRVVSFVVQDDGSTRGRLTAVDDDGDYVGIKFHQDGKPVMTPFLRKGKWTAIGIDFEPMIDFSGRMGGIGLVSGAVFNNIVIYRTSKLQEQYTYIYRRWASVLEDRGTKRWQDWSGKTWDSVAKVMTIDRGFSIDAIYKSYIGTNVHPVGDDSMMIFGGNVATIISNETVAESDEYQTRFVTRHEPKWQEHTINAL